jgi:hypothetical protein
MPPARGRSRKPAAMDQALRRLRELEAKLGERMIEMVAPAPAEPPRAEPTPPPPSHPGYLPGAATPPLLSPRLGRRRGAPVHYEAPRAKMVSPPEGLAPDFRSPLRPSPGPLEEATETRFSVGVEGSNRRHVEWVKWKCE